MQLSRSVSQSVSQSEESKHYLFIASVSTILRLLRSNSYNVDKHAMQSWHYDSAGERASGDDEDDDVFGDEVRTNTKDIMLTYNTTIRAMLCCCGDLAKSK